MTKEDRDAVIKNGYSAQKLADRYDAVIIGSGIGGLVAAAILARAGKKVLVLEQHDQAGGCCHTFHEKGFEFDTGIHYIGEMRNNTALKFLCDQLTDGKLQWANVCDDFDTVVLVDSPETPVAALQQMQEAIASAKALPSKSIPFMSGEEETIQSLLVHFPEEEEAIRKYFGMLASVRREMLGFISMKMLPHWVAKLLVNSGLVSVMTKYFLYASQSVTEVLTRLTRNASLRTVLAYNFGDYGTLPGDAPFTMHAALQSHMMRGVSYPVGGASQIALSIIPTITAAGGAVLVRCPVESIVTENGAAIGVQLKRDKKVISCKCIISDAGLLNTVSMLPESSQNAFQPMLRHVRSGTGGFSVYVGLKGSAKELGVEGKHYWAVWNNHTDASSTLDTITTSYLQRGAEYATSGPVPVLFISFPSAKDPLWDARHPNKTTATIVTFANYEWFEKWGKSRVMHRGEEYTSRKQALGELIWQQTLALFPQLKDKVEYFDVGSPVTNKYYLGANRGEMYGLDHDLKRFTAAAAVDLRPDTPLKGLFLTGQDVLSCGFAGATFGGLLCASKVLNRNVYEDITKLKKSCTNKRVATK